MLVSWFLTSFILIYKSWKEKLRIYKLMLTPEVIEVPNKFFSFVFSFLSFHSLYPSQFPFVIFTFGNWEQKIPESQPSHYLFLFVGLFSSFTRGSSFSFIFLFLFLVYILIFCLLFNNL